MPTLRVQPRPTPAERPDTTLEIEVDETIAIHAATIDEWIAPRQNWEFTLREGHEFDRANNVEGILLFVAGEQTSSLMFRMEQLDTADDLGDTLLLTFEEKDGIAKTAQLTQNGLDVELHHILTFT
jgi:hypothetical protein